MEAKGPNLSVTGSAPAFPAAESTMWKLVQRYTNRVGYERGAKASGLAAVPPVIDCSGWVAYLLAEAMRAENAIAGEDVFNVTLFEIEIPYSEQILSDIEARTPLLIEGSQLTLERLPRCATIALNEGCFSWQENFPRPRGINHIVQIVRRPDDDAPFVSESYSSHPPGIRLTPLADWLAARSSSFQSGKAWGVDPFTIAKPTRVLLK